MADQSYPTIIHERVDMARRGENPTVVCRLRSGWVVLGDDQRLPGYSLLLADPIQDNLNALSAADRQQFLMDMACIGDALMEGLNPSLINYSILGHSDRALHAHIHPRYDSEEPDKRRTHPIIYHWLKLPYVQFNAERDAPLQARLREALTSRTEIVE